MIIAIAQLNYHIGNLQYTIEKILATLGEAREKGADLVVFAEMAIGGYPAKDLWLSFAFIDQCQQALEVIAADCQDIACIIGAPIRNTTGVGKPLFNAAVFIADGKIQQAASKALIPDYDVFDEYRYFQASDTFECIEYKGVRIALTVCEDLWNVTQPALYHEDPMARLAEQKPDVMINIAASPFAVGHHEERFRVLNSHIAKHRIPLIYANQIGAHADLIFDGRSMVLDKQGQLVSELSAFDEQLLLVSFDTLARTMKPLGADPTIPNEYSDNIALIHDALILGIRDYFGKNGFKQAILGLSGGLDSALVAALVCEAIGAENLMAVLLPSEYSSDHSLTDALDLVANTGCMHYVIPIHQPTEAFGAALAEVFAKVSPDTTEENIQARTRSIILMALSNKFGYTLLNTSNKSEAAVGYGTLYGDMAGALSVIGDIYKTQAYELANYINREREIIPVHTIQKPPSAELRPDQKDSDSLPDYAILDAVLYRYIEENKDAAAIKSEGYNPALVDRILKMVDQVEFKRFQAPPVLRVSKKSFGSGRSMPLVAKRTYLK